ncbi:MAG: zinc metallopeptidase [Lachnospiraceae bacterium]|nr:zinc metallopeptidase [Candidatus Minthocola equi]
MFWDSTYILVLIGAALSMIASAAVNSAFNKYNKVRSAKGYTSNEVAAKMLEMAGITDVRIEHVKGNMTDHYSPDEKVLRLSDSVYNSTSVAAIGVAAHECGHAIQHKQGYGPLKLRSLSVPVANIGSKLSWPILIVGLLFGLPDIAKIGVVLFVFVVLFQLITLPVEFNASRRALKILDEKHLLYTQDMEGARKVLRAAAMTYVAALASAILQLLRLVLLVNRRR